ncbi:MAG TPA: ATP-binding cassette domain-containing protein [Beutenbergiaceae bacterium]|nr:ATP-binding cassette domain-containing protein [Beutenbergiaceae bacterium]
MAELILEGVSVTRFSRTICHDVAFQAHAGQVAVISGPNGSGKTSFLNALMGVIPLSQGTIHLHNTPVHLLAAHRRVKLGMGYVPYDAGLFTHLSVDQTLRLAHTKHTIQDVYDLFPELHRRKDTVAGVLSGGEQRVLGIAKTLGLQPTVLLLDEPMVGLSAPMRRRVTTLLNDIASRGAAVVVADTSPHAYHGEFTAHWQLTHAKLEPTDHPERN